MSQILIKYWQHSLVSNVAQFVDFPHVEPYKVTFLFPTSHSFVLIYFSFQTLPFLQQNAKERSESSANTTSTSTTSYTLPQTSTKMSMQELDELRKKLGNVTASSNAPLVSVSYSGDHFTRHERIDTEPPLCLSSHRKRKISP